VFEGKTWEVYEQLREQDKKEIGDYFDLRYSTVEWDY
jgi:hypothetical protein